MAFGCWGGGGFGMPVGVFWCNIALRFEDENVRIPNLNKGGGGGGGAFWLVSGTIVPLLTKALGVSVPCQHQHGSNQTIPKTGEYGGCSQPPLMREV